MKKFKKHILASLLFLATLVFIVLVLHWLRSSNNKAPDVFQDIAVSIIITWIIFLIAYFVWAINFYNVNLGWTDEDWAAKKGLPINNVVKTDDGSAVVLPVSKTDESSKEPDENPNAGESLGLPTGTVRATIALSLLVAALALVIASFSMDATYPLNSLFIDHFEFIKTGILMMIAFYFGAKSLDILRKTNNAAIVTKGDPAPPPAPAPHAEIVDQTNPEANVAAPTAPSVPAKPFNDPSARG